ncbi:MAG: hypothetical protein JKY38_16665, partial [Ralstonia sp.]|nr:hypothetical protein [Ralstonia sp.]
PVTDDGTKWVEQGATNKWKPFDTYLSDKATGTTEITWDFTVPSDKNWDRVAIFGPEGTSVTVEVVDSGESVVFTSTITLADPDFVHDGWTTFWNSLRSLVTRRCKCSRGTTIRAPEIWRENWDRCCGAAVPYTMASALSRMGPAAQWLMFMGQEQHNVVKAIQAARARLQPHSRLTTTHL